ncbi:Gamma-glutamylputrescine oxidoreductase [Roseovarius albus]|uniref:Gamma-glutamylputrescine oxidoreductase n=1 Tax=Roseovarius albus TaxID=1247867 RepID=A0A1X6Y6R0_9RHOB|nr:FAD-binding oxidoreductase [Roseovarius albus]SLN12343.1 Gamma-glutamylputrescine oxidoreductase [Roseovarius albus]
MSYPNSYYAATASDRASLPALAGVIEVDTCIIGGGYAGLSTALGLVERAHTDIAVIDAQGIGFGCSGRNGGFAFGGFSLHEHGLIKAVGAQKARELYGLTTEGIELIRQRINSYEIDCEAIWDGVLLCNWFKDEKIQNDHQTFMADSFGVELDYMSKDALREVVKSECYNGALVDKKAFHFHPLKYALGLTEEAHKGGAQIYANTPASRIKPDGPVKIVHTPNGVIRAKRLVICCGGYLEGLYKPLVRSSLPIATYVMATEPLGDRLDEAFTYRHAIYDTRFAFDYYRPMIDSRLMWGGRVSVNLNEPKDLDQLLYGDLMKVFPQLEGVKVDYAWQGLMSWSAHKMPQIGEERPGIWYAQAFGGHGVAATNIAGDLLAAAIAEGDTRYKMLADRFRLTSTFGPLGKIGAEATYQYYMLRDRMKE